MFLRIEQNRDDVVGALHSQHRLDEWQDAPVLWDAVRTMCDKRGVPGQFILTGSNAVDETKIHHSGTGRISRMQMSTMSLWESKESNGSISLKELFNNPQQDIEAISDLNVNDIIFTACRGGWPAITGQQISLMNHMSNNLPGSYASRQIMASINGLNSPTLTAMVARYGW